tara:strand:- start:3349 stop:3843 length:495 start_codon:yes stop_codon:yes gene_type:complete
MARVSEMSKHDKRKTFWANNSPFQKQYDEMWNKFTPSENEVNFENQGLKPNARLEELMEAQRGMSRLYYDYFNNGSCNTIEQSRWNGEYDIEWNDYYENFADSIDNVIGGAKNQLFDICRKIAINDSWGGCNKLEDLTEALHKICWAEYQKVKDDYVEANSYAS